MSKSAYCVRADRGTYAEAFRRGGYAAIGWEGIGDLSGVPTGDNEALGDIYDAAYPEVGAASRGQGIGQIRQFVWGLEVGDVVVAPMKDSRYLLTGVVESPYYYKVTLECPFGHRRKVRWSEEPVSRSSLSVSVQSILKVPHTVFGVRPPGELLRAAGLEVPESEPAERVERDASALVINRLLELDADEFEILVAELLTALDFEAEKVGRGGDGGVDVEGTLDVYGLVNVDLRVQVKRYKRGNIVGHEAIERFRASVPERAQAAFVTTSGYTKKAREAAEREGYKRIGLVDGEQLVDILSEEYERLPAEVREKLGLRRALVIE